MKRTKIKSVTEEKIITAMITSTEFLSNLSETVEINLFTAAHFKTLARWCIKYFNKYKKAPEHHIENIYHSWVGKGKAKEETVDAVHDVLELLSESYEQEKLNNIPYLVDEAGEFFSKRKLELLRDNLDFALMENDINMAENAVDSFSNVVLDINRGVDAFRDETPWRNAYSESQKPLFTVGNERTNRFFGNDFIRDSLVGILGPEKRGKSYYALEFMLWALKSRRKVAVFEVGDMSEGQTYRRMGARLSKKPMFKKDCGKIKIPYKVIKIGKDVEVKCKTKIIETPASYKDSKIARKKFMRRFGLSHKQSYLMTSHHSNYSINVSGIASILKRWEIRNDFVPDVIIIDYPDILADEPNTSNYSKRDKENVKWMALRRLSQDTHGLVIVPTQADSKSYNVKWLTMDNFSEDKRKLSHVTGMIGLNQLEDEKEIQLMRLNWIVRRDDAFLSKKGLYLGQCLKLGRPFCCGYY